MESAHAGGKDGNCRVLAATSLRSSSQLHPLRPIVRHSAFIPLDTVLTLGKAMASKAAAVAVVRVVLLPSV